MSHTPGPWTVCAGDPRYVSLPGIVKPINAGNAANARVVAASLDLADSLREVADMLAAFVKSDGGCDHSVGICYCTELRAIDRARDALTAAGVNHD